MTLDTSFSQTLSKKMAMLSKPQQRIATFVLENPFKVAISSIEEFASDIGMSTATANRFVKALGYSGYPLFRQDLIKGFESALAAVNRLKKDKQNTNSSPEIFSHVLSETQKNIALTQQTINRASCKKAINMILNAPRIFILGFGSSAYLSRLMERRLFPYNQMVTSLSTEGGVSEVARRLTLSKKNDLVIAISFPRYLSDTIQLAQDAKKRGANILAITDKITAPIVPHAHCSLYAHSHTEYGQNSEATTLALIEAILAAIDYQSSQAVEKATQMTQTIVPWLVKDSIYNSHN